MTEAACVRIARKDELDEISKLFSKILEDLPYYNSLAKENELRKYTPPKLAEKQKQDKYSVLVALDESNEIVGFCFNHFDDFTIWLDWFGVKPPNRKKGTGGAIIQALFKTATERGAHKVWCDTRTSNEASKNLLRKLGFKEIAEVKNHWYKQDFILWERFM
jgi:ribosomal protein S18 acetylase RimI-like enzyme